MKNQKSCLCVWGMLALMALVLTFSSCSKEERVLPIYTMRATALSSALQQNDGLMFQVQRIIVSHYDEGYEFMAAEEGEALVRYENTIKSILSYNWAADGLTLQPESYFTLQLITEGVLVKEQVIILRN
ncbi:MAG: hypothetical protein IJ244_07340 [Bacteroidaceae bacterium]|nr:hypothetical protein [Bacteroidaceae bacterium]